MKALLKGDRLQVAEEVKESTVQLEEVARRGSLECFQ
jgi:hypothetical protein